MNYFDISISIYGDYIQSIEELINVFENNDNSKIQIPFIITAASALECFLNDKLEIYTFRFQNAPNEEYSSQEIIRDSLFSLKFKQKLEAVIPLITDNKFCINKKSQIYINLAELITYRNKLVHNKPPRLLIQNENEYDEENRLKLSINKKQLIKTIENSKICISLNKCKEIFNALIEFIDYIDSDGDWKTNQFIKMNVVENK
ncbi:MAG: hypothetical protein A2Y41_06625 [Spirochaetes bacterium GWB1_36_13]|nr:MAG: hypothetical protein A2Y41_06625 [Spirochaetes bacterium GWB1_36_13]